MKSKQTLIECLSTREVFHLNKRIVFDNLVEDTETFKHACDEIKSDKEIIIEILDSGIRINNYYDNKYYCILLDILKYIKPELLEERTFVVQLIRLDPKAILYCDARFRKDRLVFNELLLESEIPELEEYFNKDLPIDEDPTEF